MRLEHEVKCYFHTALFIYFYVFYFIFFKKRTLTGIYVVFFFFQTSENVKSAASVLGCFFFNHRSVSVSGSATFSQVVHLRTECHMFASQTCHSMAGEENRRASGLAESPGS